ncbi:MAG: hypothetical protein M1826_006187 [Phylliscum demangeonii]|nr:MAG: hypothetical protein M1826_006187 [Phylliscum demangeonii]
MATHHDLPIRRGTAKENAALPDEDPGRATALFIERLEAWRHASVYLEDYVLATQRVHKAHVKEYDKVLTVRSTFNSYRVPHREAVADRSLVQRLQTITSPLKEVHQFDQSLGGIQGLFEKMRTNTQGIAHVHSESERSLHDSVLPVFRKLESEIESKIKEIAGGATKGSKSVGKARTETQALIDSLGEYTSSFEAKEAGAHKIDPSTDPYVIQRQLYHRLHRQLQEENESRQDVIGLQGTFEHFEAHVVQTLQRALTAFAQTMILQGDRTKELYGDMATTASRIPLDFEWKHFLGRHNNILIDPSSGQRSIANVHFPHQNHAATQPVLAGLLQRKKGWLGKGYSTSYYVVTASKYLHEFHDDDRAVHVATFEPLPELSLYLPQCTVGHLADARFAVKGKDVSKGKVGQAFATRHELEFMADNPAQAEQWWKVIRGMAEADLSAPDESPVASPVDATAAHRLHQPPPYVEKAPQLPPHEQGLPAPPQQPLPLQGDAKPGTGRAPGI